MFKKILLSVIILVLFLPINCYAKTIYYNDAKIKFDIDDSYWVEKSLTSERKYIDKKWVSDCGIITSGSYDIYHAIDVDDNMSREYYNYKYFLNNEQDALNFADDFDNQSSLGFYDFKKYKMNFVKYSGVMQKNDIIIDFDNYITINNGYVFFIQYQKSDLINSETCSNSISEIVSSIESTIPVKSLGDDNKSYFDYLIYSLIGIVITFLGYEIYPFIRVLLTKKKYNKQEVKRMSLWNSIIVFLIFSVIVLLLNMNAAINTIPAFIYYWINTIIWVNKTKYATIDKDLLADEVKDNNFTCSSCGAGVNDNDNFCPNCGELFETDEEYTDIDQKYSDLKKLKELLDSKIITKKEFEKEKNKILK